VPIDHPLAGVLLISYMHASHISCIGSKQAWLFRPPCVIHKQPADILVHDARQPCQFHCHQGAGGEGGLGGFGEPPLNLNPRLKIGSTYIERV